MPPFAAAGGVAMIGDELQFDWAGLVPHFVHPIKVEIIEAMIWIGQPLSASELAQVFFSEYDLSRVSYHLSKLAKAGVFEQVGQRQVRGAMQRFYYFPAVEPA